MDDIRPVQRSASALRRALVNRWRWIVALWVLGAVGLGYLCTLELKPQFRASSLIRVAPSGTDLYDLANGKPDSLDGFLGTQVALITSPNVLTAAGGNPKAQALPRIQAAGDVVIELKKLIQVSIIPGTYLYEVSMTGPSASEAATLVNAVVEAYIESTGEWSDGMNRSQIKNLETYLADLENQSEAKERKWKELFWREAEAQKSDDRLAKIEAKRLDNEIQKLDARSRLDALEQLVGEKRIAEADAVPQRVELLTRVRAAEILDNGLVARAEQLRTTGADTAIGVNIAILQQKRAHVIEMQQTVNKRLEQLKFESKGEARVRLVNVAVPPARPIDQRLITGLIAASVVTLFASMGIVWAIEALGGFRRSRPAEERFGPI